jgi:iron complex outermembrane receptor protein
MAASAASGVASMAPSPQTLPTVSVEAAPLPSAPVGVSVRTARKQLAKQNIADSAAVLRYFPNLQVRQRYIGDPNAIISGRDSGTLQSARSLVYADGLLLSNFMTNGWNGGPRWGMVAPQSIESVEVLYGPYSALYPGNSIGNTVLIHTRLPDGFTAGAAAQFLSQDYHDDYGARSRYDGHRLAAHLGDHNGRWRWLVSVDQLDNHGQPMQYAVARAGGDPAHAVAVSGATLDRNINGSPRLIYGANSIEHTRQTQATLQASVDLTDNIEVRFTLGGWHNRAFDATRSFLRDASGQPVSGGTILADGHTWTLPVSGLAPSAFDQTHVLIGAQLDGHFDNGWHWEAVASRYDFQHDLEHDAAAAQTNAGTLADMGGSGWDTFDLRASGPLGEYNTLYAGAHLDRYLLDSRVTATHNWRSDAGDGGRVNAYGGRTQTRALYVQDIWDLAPAWSLTLGARWEQWRAYRGSLADATTTVAYPSRRRSDVSPKASLEWRFASAWRLRLSFGKAVRYPTVEELFQGSLSNNAIVNNNPNLEPERDWSTDLDLVRNLPNGRWRVSLYQDRFADTLYSQTDITLPVPVTSVQNIDAVRMRGIEGALQLRDVLPGVDLDASVAWNDAVTLRDAQYAPADGKRFPRIPRVRASLFAHWRFAPGWDASLGVRRSGRQYSTLDNSDFVNTYGAVSAFTVADAKLRWHFARQWTASLGVDNLTNERYWVYHPYAGRTWFGGVSWNLGGPES